MNGWQIAGWFGRRRDERKETGKTWVGKQREKEGGTIMIWRQGRVRKGGWRAVIVDEWMKEWKCQWGRQWKRKWQATTGGLGEMEESHQTNIYHTILMRWKSWWEYRGRWTTYTHAHTHKKTPLETKSEFTIVGWLREGKKNSKNKKRT